MENGLIFDGQLSASSQLNANVAANKGRLNTYLGWNSWSSLTNDANQWLQIDVLGLGKYTKVTRVATQGKGSSRYSQWVTKYKLQYSDDRVNFQYYKEQGQTKDKVEHVCFRVAPDLRSPVCRWH